MNDVDTFLFAGLGFFRVDLWGELSGGAEVLLCVGSRKSVSVICLKGTWIKVVFT